MTKETINSLYIYTVLTITIIISLIGLANVLDSSLELVIDTSYRTPYSEFVTNLKNECANSLQQKSPVGETQYISARLSKSECAELNTNSHSRAAESLFAEQEQLAKENEIRSKLSRLISSIPWFLVPLPLFFIFNKMRKEQK